MDRLWPKKTTMNFIWYVMKHGLGYVATGFPEQQQIHTAFSHGYSLLGHDFRHGAADNRMNKAITFYLLTGLVALEKMHLTAK